MSTDTVLEFHAEAPQATASQGLAQGPYEVARAGFGQRNNCPLGKVSK